MHAKSKANENTNPLFAIGSPFSTKEGSESGELQKLAELSAARSESILGNNRLVSAIRVRSE